MTAILGVHHVKIPVTELARSRAWYERILPLEVELEFRDDDGTLRGVAYRDVNGFALALREDASRAAALRGFNPVAVLVGTRDDLVALAERLSHDGVDHTPVIRASLGWLLGAADPDGVELRFYTKERHTAEGATASS